MNNTRVYNTRRSKNEKIANYAYAYVYSEKLKENCLPDSLPEYDFVMYLDAITGDGTVNTTILDLVKWDKALREDALVQKTTLERGYIYPLLRDNTSWFIAADFDDENICKMINFRIIRTKTLS